MAAPIITPIPTPPIRSDAPADFSSKADAFVAALPQFVTETNGSASFVDQRAIDADASAQAAAASEGAAASSVAAAAYQVALATEQAGLATTNGQAQVALSANQVALAANQVTLAAEQAALATTNGQAQVALATNQAARSESAADQAEIAAAAAGAAAGLPALTGNARKALVVRPDESGVEFATVGSELKRSARTANLMLAAADKGWLIDITSGTFTQTFAPAAELGGGWFCYLKNSGSGDITLDPNGAETVDGLTSYVMYPGECRLIQCDGVGFYTVLIAGNNYQQFSSSGVWSKPPGVTWVYVEIVNGGSSGQARADSITAAVGGVGGAGGARLEMLIKAATLPETVSVIVGSGGAALTTSTLLLSGLIGGTSSFNAISPMPGASFDKVNAYAYSASPASIDCVKGGAGGGMITSGVAQAPGVSQLDGSGGEAVRNASGGAAIAASGEFPGGGGGAASADYGQTATSGPGGNGVVRIWAW